MTSDAPEGMRVFDRRAVLRHRARAARGNGTHDFLVREVAERLADRLADVKRDFPLVLDLACRGGALSRAFDSAGVRKARGIQTIIHADGGFDLAARAPAPRVVADEEFLPFAEGSLDLVLSNLSLHWVNDLPGALVQIKRALRPDGLFLAALLGGETLHELRAAFEAAETDVEGGVSPRVSPLIDVRDAGGLLQRAGFALPVTDVDTINVTYADAAALMRDLRGMGETNAVRQRRTTFLRRDTLARVAEVYRERFADAGGRIRATFQVVYLTGWAPHESQQKPLRPGSAKTRLADALGAEELPTGDKADPGG